MPRKLSFILAALLALPNAASGAICALDPRPGATLLLPYFEVDADGPPGLNTIFTVVNTSQKGILVQAMIWTETGFPIFAFPMYLGGYDEQSVDMSTLVLTSVYPTTRLNALARQRFPSCPEVLEGTTGTHLPNLRGKEAMVEYLNGSRPGYARPPRDTGSHLARGFVTVDVVRVCSQYYPGTAYYFLTGGRGVATNDNVLLGHFLYTDLRSGRGYVQSGRMVSLEADGNDPRTSTWGSYTFYGRRIGFSAADNREPLGTVQAAQYLAGAGLEAEVIYWRDSRAGYNPYDVFLPSWFPLGETQVTIFDEERRATAVPLPVTPSPFPAMTGKTAVIPPPHPLPTEPPPFMTTALNRLLVDHPFGWMHLNLNLPRVGMDSLPSQSWAAVVVRRPGDPGMSVLMEGFSMDDSCAPNLAPLVLPGQPQRERPAGDPAGRR